MIVTDIVNNGDGTYTIEVKKGVYNYTITSRGHNMTQGTIEIERFSGDVDKVVVCTQRSLFQNGFLHPAEYLYNSTALRKIENN